MFKRTTLLGGSGTHSPGARTSEMHAGQPRQSTKQNVSLDEGQYKAMGDAHIFLRVWVYSLSLFCATIVLVNIGVDPYGFFDSPKIVGLNARKSQPAGLANELMIKSYDVLRHDPRTLLLGSSTVDFGLDARHPSWPSPPAYNLSIIAGSDPYISYRLIQHVMAQRPISSVVLGLDFEFFLTEKVRIPTGSDFELRLTVTADGNINSARQDQQLRDALQSTLSLSALMDSLKTVFGNAAGTLPEFVSGNIPISYMQRAVAPRSYFPIAAHDLVQLRRYDGKRFDPNVMPQVEKIIDLCTSNKISLILLVNPVHADMLEIIDLLGFWTNFEDWKRDLVTLTEQRLRVDGGNLIQLWDFSGYDSYSTEPVPRDQHLMRWFWDTNHYTHALGDLVVRRIIEGRKFGFGVLLSQDNLESHLNDIRQQREQYRLSMASEVQRVHYLYTRRSQIIYNQR